MGTFAAMDLAARGPSAIVRVALFVATSCLVTGTTSCSSSDGSTPGLTATLPTAPSDSTTTTTIEDVEAEVREAYLAAERTFYEAGQSETFDPDDLAVGRTGRSLKLVVRGLELADADGVYADYGKDYPVAKITKLRILSSRRAELISCVTDDAVVRRRADDVTVNNDVVSRRYRVTLVRDGGLWKIAEEEVLESKVGRKLCA